MNISEAIKYLENLRSILHPKSDEDLPRDVYDKMEEIIDIFEDYENLKIYICSDCGQINYLEDNGRNRVGFCSDCTHPLWNNKWNNKLEEKIKEHKL